MERRWSTGLFDCWCSSSGDWRTTCLGCWCPCILYGKNVEALEGEEWSSSCCDFALVRFFSTIFLCGGSLCVMPALTLQRRKSIREAYKIEEKACCGSSYCVQCFCLRCSLCQEARELKRRGHTLENPLVKHFPPPATPSDAQNDVTTRAPTQIEAKSEAPAPAPAPAPAAEDVDVELVDIPLGNERELTTPELENFLLRMLTSRSEVGPSGRADVSFGFMNP